MGEIKKKISHFWANGLSIDETKVSVLLALLIIAFGIAMYQFLTVGDISDRHLSIITLLIYAVTGINGLNIITDFLKHDRDNKESTIE